MISFIKYKNGFDIEVYLIPKCFLWMNHNWGKWSKAFKVYGAHYKQVRFCKDCNRMDTRDAGFINAELPVHTYMKEQ